MITDERLDVLLSISQPFNDFEKPISRGYALICVDAIPELIAEIRRLRNVIDAIATDTIDGHDRCSIDINRLCLETLDPLAGTPCGLVE